MVSTTDGRFVCENMVSGPNAGNVLCVKLTTTGQLAQIYAFRYSVNDGEGLTGTSNATVNDLLFVRRATNSSGTGTGILMKATDGAEPLSPSVQREALEQAADLPIGQ